MVTRGQKNDLNLYVLYNTTTSDYPGEWVVRRQTVTSGAKVEKAKELAARGPTRDQCILDLFEKHPVTRSMAFLKAQPDDDWCIDGTFL